MLELLEAYRDKALEYGSQVEMLEVGNYYVDFLKIFDRLGTINHLNTRSPRFDFLESVARDNDFYIVPPSAYIQESSEARLSRLVHNNAHCI